MTNIEGQRFIITSFQRILREKRMQIVERELVEMKIRLKVFSIFYFFEPRVVGKHNVKMLGYVGKAPRICF
jgi:hypothetical protein